MRGAFLLPSFGPVDSIACAQQVVLQLGALLFCVSGIGQALCSELPELYVLRTVSGFAIGLTAAVVPLSPRGCICGAQVVFGHCRWCCSGLSGLTTHRNSYLVDSRCFEVFFSWRCTVSSSLLGLPRAFQ